MKTIQSTFTAGGFVHELIERTGDIALFRRFAVGGGPEHFEVVRIRRHNGFPIPGSLAKFGEVRHAPPAEIYPIPERWGTDGFTFNALEMARLKFAELAEIPVPSR